MIKSKDYFDSSVSRDRDVISLFSGAMGLDLGLEYAGLNVVVGQDFDHNCAQTMRANGRRVLEGDVRAITSSDLLDVTGLKRGEPFMICGGPPCQPFSIAGKRQGVNDPRGSLFVDFVRMIDEIRPRFFIMENVRGLTSAPLKQVSPEERDESDPQQRLGTVLEIILEEFAKLRYRTVHGVLDAVNYGVPQYRERFILMGSRDGEELFMPFPTHFQTHQHPQYRWRTLGDVISNLSEDEQEYSPLSDERKAYLRLVPEGGNWRDLPEHIIPQAMGGAYHSGGGKVGFYRRLSMSQPSPTLTTSPAQKATMLCHPKMDRPLSVQEYARIQQFPDDWIFFGATASKYRQIGNAVPVGLAYALGQSVAATADGSAKVFTKRFREKPVRPGQTLSLLSYGLDQ